MKKRIYQVTALAAGSFLLSAAVRSGEVTELLYDSALSGGSLQAAATISLGNLGQLLMNAAH
ncbi:hypothetical protein [uncultured Oxalicibacterium sp.]|uniref:hypothetical protein n=1 Tax=uncultured Oxalicibacterium sp. TaxID=1168540 RepID=UPI0025F90A28|nr:hypothetical protein [uncultured Oxalicibacterium sp.]